MKTDMKTDRIEKMLDLVNESTIKFKFVMAGKTGVGKSSVINAILETRACEVASDARPCTKKNKEVIWNTDIGEIRIVDVPGFGEANAPLINGGDYIENIRLLSKDAHILLLVLKCDDKALELEQDFYKLWIKDEQLNKIPIIIVVNQIDKVKPTRDWNPLNLSLKNPTTQKEKNICDYIQYVATIFERHPSDIVPVYAGESLEDTLFGIDELKEKINSKTSEVLELVIDRKEQSQDDRAKRIIRNYSLTAATAAIQPVPIVDSFIIAPIQIAMIIHLGKVYNVHIGKSIAGGIVESIGLSLAGNYIFLTLVSFIPGLKQVMGPAIAYSLTYTSGLIIKELLLTNNLNPTKKELKILAEKYKEEAVRAKKEYEEEHEK